MSEDISAALGMAFGAIVTAARKSGVSDEELQRWLDITIGSYRMVHGEPAES